MKNFKHSNSSATIFQRIAIKKLNLQNGNISLKEDINFKINKKNY